MLMEEAIEKMMHHWKMIYAQNIDSLQPNKKVMMKL